LGAFLLHCPRCSAEKIFAIEQTQNKADAGFAATGALAAQCGNP
jgi:hypothetical protein